MPLGGRRRSGGRTTSRTPAASQLHVARARRSPRTSSTAHIPPGTRSVSVFLVNQPPARHGPARPRLRLPARARGARATQPFVPRPDLRGAQRRGVGRAGGRPPLRRHARVRDRPRRLGRLGDRRRRRAACCARAGSRAPRSRRPRPWTIAGRRALDGGARRARRRRGRARGARAARRAATATWIDDAASERSTALTGDAPRDGRGAAAPRRHRRRPDRARHRRRWRTTPTRSTPSAWRTARWRGRSGSGSTIDEPRWRAFQLAFILLNLPGLADPRDPQPRDRRPALLPDRRRQDRGVPRPRRVRDGAAAAAPPGRRRARGRRRERDHALHAAAAHARSARARRRARLRARARARAGRRSATATWPFEIGLWVGKAATPNILGRKGDGRSDTARAKVRQFKADPKGKPSPIPLENCPWCGTRFAPDSFTLLPERRPARASCASSARTSSATSPRPRAADRRRGRADLPAAPGVPHRDGRQVRVAPVGRAVRGAARRRRAARRDGLLRRRRAGQGHAPRRRRCRRPTS